MSEEDALTRITAFACCALQVIALRNAGFNVRVKFISEIDPKVMEMFDIMADHMGVEVEHKHADMTTRPVYKDVDFYCYSGPCQSYSTCGNEEAMLPAFGNDVSRWSPSLSRDRVWTTRGEPCCSTPRRRF